MAGYLESYAAAEEGKAKTRHRLKVGSIVFVTTVVAAFFLYAAFRNYREEQIVKTFVHDLQNHQEKQAYGLWGCTDQTPCRDYDFKKFDEDWGPASEHGAQKPAIAISQSCGNGTFIRLEYPKGEPVGLMVDKSARTISFAPSTWAECPGRHWHFLDFIRRSLRG